MVILTVLVFSKYFYIACMTNYFTFFLMDKFAVQYRMHNTACSGFSPHRRQARSSAAR